MKGIADTGFLVAFVSRDDAFHNWAVGLADQLDEPLVAGHEAVDCVEEHGGAAAVCSSTRVVGPPQKGTRLKALLRARTT